MPDTTPLPPDVPPAPATAKRVTKPRAPRKKAVVEVVAPAPALVMAPSADEALLAAGVVRQASDELDAVHARRDQLLDSIAAAERRLAELREAARALEDLSAVRTALDQADEQIREASQRATDVHREAAEAAETFRDVSGLLDASRANVDAVRKAVDDADDAAKDAQERAAAASAEAARAEQVLAAARAEFGALDADARRTLDEFRTALEAVKAAPKPEPLPAAPPQPALPALALPPAEPPAPPVPESAAAVRDPNPLPEVAAVPSAELATDAWDRLARYLNDAAAVAKEQAGLMQSLADGTDDAELRAALEAHRDASRRQLAAVEGRVRALGAQPTGGRGVLGSVVTRMWDALQKPRDAADDAVEGLVKALGAAEFGAAAYLTAYAVAKAAGDAETAALLASHYREERTLADRLRGLVPAAAGRAARRAAS